jgi:DNA-binding transcriptional LysR family regulator
MQVDDRECSNVRASPGWSTRTTRRVAPTQAGERLLDTAGPRLDEIEAELTRLTEMRDRPAGSIRITTSGHAARTILLPKLAPLLRQYPDIKVELVVEQGLTDSSTAPKT